MSPSSSARHSTSAPSPLPDTAHSSQQASGKSAVVEGDVPRPIEVLALVVMERNIRCRLPSSEQQFLLRPDEPFPVAPGQLLTVHPFKQWRYGGWAYLSGHIEGARVDAAALGLQPLRLRDWGVWDPKGQYWGESGEPLEEWARAVLARGPRPCHEMEQVRPGLEEEDPSTDLILLANDLKEIGDLESARELLAWMLEADLRCLDAHAHLGNLAFSSLPVQALHHYEVGVRIGELALGKDFEGVLPWGLVDNRPFLRCLHGYALCLWRLGRLQEAARVFERQLWLNPSDNQGVRFLLADVREGRRWVSE